MHKGHTYPFLREFWQAECFFWPGFVPRKLYVEAPLGYGSSWDRLAGGVVTDVGVPDFFSVGDPFWSYVDPFGGWALEVLLHKVASPIPKSYSITARIVEVGPSVAVLQHGQVESPQYSFGGWYYDFCSNFPPYSLGAIFPLLIRAAVWSEV